MTGVVIEPVREYGEAVAHVAAHLRAADRKEIIALTGREPRDALVISLDHAFDAYVARLSDGEPVAVLGSGYITLGDTAVPWMVATDRLNEVVRPLMKLSRRYIAHLRAHSSWLENIVHVDNEASIRYLKVLGFGFSPDGVLPNGERYRRFMMEGLRDVR